MTESQPSTLTSAQKRELKSKAQHLEPVVRIGKSGLTPAVVHSILQALDSRSLIKVRLDQEREERDVLAVEVAKATGAELIWQVGKAAVYYRKKPESAAEAPST